MCKVYSVASMKGGVTKTTTTLNLATALALMGKKVLAIDLDPQGSLSICAGVPNPDKLTHTTYTLLDIALDEDESLNPHDYIISCGKVDVIPCNIKLSAFELNRGHEIGAERALQTAIEPLREKYDIIIIDTPPSLGILTANALTASNGVIIPVTPQLLSAVGMKMLIKTIQKIQKHINPNVAIEGVLMSMCDIRTNLYKDISNIMEETYCQTVRIFETVIPHSTKVGEANLRQQSVLVYDEKSKPSQAYMNFAKELMGNG
ncbi:MAG: ParA family protein [Defluviitaleaceae bacterium]|nr:ParA family protein [Defluviitaleaceae bacterium]MCL2275014.1 ParA family protein [Defluviitaleaceae bacterium]